MRKTNRVASGGLSWENPTLTTLTVDAKKRVRLPDAKPGQVFSVEGTSEAGFTLIPVKVDSSEPFPPGSLLKYFTDERDELETILAKGCVQGPE